LKRRLLRLLLVPAVIVCGLAGIAPVSLGAHLPPGFRDETVFEGLEEPTIMRFAPNEKIFVAEKTGKIEVFDSLQDTAPTLFADLRTDVYDTGDRGILGLAIDPNFETNHRVYVLYTYDHLLGDSEPPPKWGEPDHSGDECEEKPDGTGVDACPVSGRLVYLVANGDHAVEEGGRPKQKTLVEGWCQQFSSHSVGDLQFDPAGNLYASGGDGSDANNVDFGEKGWPEPNECNDPPAGIGGHEEPPTAEGGALRAQDARTPNPLDLTADPTDLNGSLIRIDSDTGEGLPGNPLYSSSLDPNERRLVGYGFRNPFRFVFDPANEEIYVANVGWNNWEEIDRLPHVPAQPYNSGWPCYEGPGPNAKYQELKLSLCEGLYSEPSATTLPFFYYKHSADVVPGDECSHEGGSAISGLAFYGASGSFPAEYDGALLFADAVRGCIYVMFPGADGRPDPLTGETFMSNAGLYPGVDLEIGPEGELYYVQLFGEGFGPGSVHRIVYDPNAPVAKLTVSPHPWGPSPLNVELDASQSTDPHGEALSYEWDLDGNGTFETAGGAKISHMFGGTENVEVAVKVTNASVHSSIARLTLYPGDSPPEPTIEEPLESLKWHVGQQIHFLGYAEQNSVKVPAANLFWKTRIRHCPSACHSHPLQAFPATDRGDIAAPDHDYPAQIEISLTGIDERGLSATKTIFLQPATVGLTMHSIPPGLQLGAGPLTAATPFVLTAIERGDEVLTAPQSEVLGGQTYTFLSWSDGGARVHSVQADSNTIYTAAYTTSTEGGESGGGGGGGAPNAMPTPSSSSTQQTVGLPGTSLGKHPPKRTRSATAKFGLTATGAGTAFRCKLDGRPWRSCSASLVINRLKPGRHLLEVVAVDRAGNSDPTPLRFKWTVLPPRRRR
jgi:glucose/arabinose dehydrogenase